MSKIIIIIALVLSLFSAETKTPKSEIKTEFKCEGKKYCKEMKSCKEAMFYLLFFQNSEKFIYLS
jgi:hypothetical protein